MWREVVYFAKLGGFGVKAALYAATMGGAAAIGQADKVGSLEPGKRADLVFLADDPTVHPETLRTPLLVAAGGRVIESPRPKRNEKIESVLDGLMKEL